MGFRVAVERLHNCPTNSFYAVIISTNPPGSLYRENRTSADVKLFFKSDPDSPARSPEYFDGLYSYQSVNGSLGAHLLFDIKEVIFNKG